MFKAGSHCSIVTNDVMERNDCQQRVTLHAGTLLVTWLGTDDDDDTAAVYRCRVETFPSEDAVLEIENDHSNYDTFHVVYVFSTKKKISANYLDVFVHYVVGLDQAGVPGWARARLGYQAGVPGWARARLGQFVRSIRVKLVMISREIGEKMATYKCDLNFIYSYLEQKDKVKCDF